MKSLFHLFKNSYIATVFLTLFALKSILVFQRFHSHTEILREQIDIDSWEKGRCIMQPQSVTKCNAKV